MSANDSLDFEDGDVVLALAKRKYRVHKAILSQKSSVFAEMLAAPPQPKSPVYNRLASGRPASMRFNFESIEKQMQYAALPTLQLHDKHEPFTLFLHALYDDPLHIYFPKLAKNTMFLISGVMDLVDKYNVSQTEMRMKFFPFIEQDWPTTLAAWDENEIFIRHLKEELEKSSQLEMLDEKLPEPAAILRFAHAYTLKAQEVQEVPSYIPAAMYHLSRLPPYADPDDIERQGHDIEDGTRTAKRTFLSHQDFVCLHHGIYNLHQAASRIAFIDFPREAEKFAGVPASEKKAMELWWRSVGMRSLLGPDRMDLLAELGDLMEALGEQETNDRDIAILRQGANRPYRNAMRAYLKRERENLWKSLAEHFSLNTFFYR